MNARILLLLSCLPGLAQAQGFAGLGGEADGFGLPAGGPVQNGQKRIGQSHLFALAFGEGRDLGIVGHDKQKCLGVKQARKPRDHMAENAFAADLEHEFRLPVAGIKEALAAPGHGEHNHAPRSPASTCRRSALASKARWRVGSSPCRGSIER